MDGCTEGILMSYSRWSYSHWYTFWHISEDEDRMNALFEICTVATFKASELRSDLDGCMAKVRKIATDATDEDMEELKRYVQEFLKDVDKLYPRGDPGGLKHDEKGGTTTWHD
jgi:hypothetical protein